MIDQALIDHALKGAWRRWSVDHGETHWRIVAATAMDLADETPGADREVAFLFGLLHDTRRRNESADVGHGQRAAGYARELLAHDIDYLRGGTLAAAISLHDQGQTTTDPTGGVCWDADRLQLSRVGIIPDEQFFSTRAGKLRIFDTPAVAAPSWPDLLRYATMQPAPPTLIKENE